MTKREFLEGLSARLAGFPQSEIEERLEFYAEMIDDRMEDGFSEEEAVAGIGSVEEIARQIAAEIPLSRIAKEKIKSRGRMRTREIVLLCAGFPIWLPLLVAAIAIWISLYAVGWSLVACVWALFGGVAGCALGGVVGGGVFACTGFGIVGCVTVGVGIFCAGLSIFGFFGALAATKGYVRLTGLFFRWLKGLLVKREVA